MCRGGDFLTLGPRPLLDMLAEDAVGQDWPSASAAGQLGPLGKMQTSAGQCGRELGYLTRLV